MIITSEMLNACIEASSLLVLYIPSREGSEEGALLDQQYWVDEALKVLGLALGGATAFPTGRGVWLHERPSSATEGTLAETPKTEPHTAEPDYNNKRLLFDETIIVHCYVGKQRFVDNWHKAIRPFLIRLGAEAKQHAVAFAFNSDFGLLKNIEHYTWR